MRTSRRKRLIAAVTAAAALVAVAPATASAGHRQPDRTLADILLADSDGDDADGFDHRWWDYDIVTQAVLLFPDLVDAASDPDADLTVFLPRDIAFYRLVRDLTGTWPSSEADAFATVASLGTDTVKTVLLYHIVPDRISYRQARKADGAVLTTLQGGTLEVKVRKMWWRPVRLIDADPDDRNPTIVRGNVGGRALNGFAHGLSHVLRPVDLP